MGRVSDHMQQMLAFLNFPENATFQEVRCFLVHSRLCSEAVILDDVDGPSCYSLFSGEEVLGRERRCTTLNRVLRALAVPADHRASPLSAAELKEYRDCVFFPDSGPDGDGGAAVVEIFYEVLHWFRNFMLECSAGAVNVAALNDHSAFHRLVLTFRQTADAMNPVLVPVGMQEEEEDAPLQCRVLSAWIYPYILTGRGRELTRIRRCRQCGLFFQGRRASAAFCTPTCRMAWNYANRL